MAGHPKSAWPWTANGLKQGTRQRLLLFMVIGCHWPCCFADLFPSFFFSEGSSFEGEGSEVGRV